MSRRQCTSATRDTTNQAHQTSTLKLFLESSSSPLPIIRPPFLSLSSTPAPPPSTTTVPHLPITHRTLPPPHHPPDLHPRTHFPLPLLTSVILKWHDRLLKAWAKSVRSASRVCTFGLSNSTTSTLRKDNPPARRWCRHNPIGAQ
jgi:hypothetical protein